MNPGLAYALVITIGSAAALAIGFAAAGIAEAEAAGTQGKFPIVNAYDALLTRIADGLPRGAVRREMRCAPDVLLALRHASADSDGYSPDPDIRTGPRIRGHHGRRQYAVRGLRVP